MKISKALELAIEVAKESNMDRYHIGAVLYDSKHVVSACNNLLGVKVQGRSNPWSLHAEEAAIIKGNRINIDFENSTMLVVRINKCGDLRLACPCRSCQKLIKSFEIPKIYFSDDPMHRSPENFKSLNK